MGAGRGHAVGGAGDDDLPGGVEVGDPDLVVGEVAGHLDLVVVEPEDGGHGARSFETGVVHGVGAGADEGDALREAEGAGGGEGGVLAEGVPRVDVGVDPEPFDGVEDHQARDEGGELGVPGVAEFVGVGVEEESADVPAGDLAGLADEVPAVVVDPGATHSGTLRPLSGEGEREHDGEARRASREVSATGR